MTLTYTSELESLLAFKLFDEVFPARKPKAAQSQPEANELVLPLRLASIRSERNEQATELAA